MPLLQPPSAPTRDEGQWRRSDVATAQGRFLTHLFSRLNFSPTGGSNACSASARERRLGGVSRSLAITSSHCRAPPRRWHAMRQRQQFARGMDEGRPDAVTGSRRAACWDSSTSPAARRRRRTLADPCSVRADAAIGGYVIVEFHGRLGIAGGGFRRGAHRASMRYPDAPSQRVGKRPIRPRHACSARRVPTFVEGRTGLGRFLASRY